MNTYVMDPSSRTAIKMRYYCSQEILKILNSIGFNVVSLREGSYIEILAKKKYKSEDDQNCQNILLLNIFSNKSPAN